MLYTRDVTHLSTTDERAKVNTVTDVTPVLQAVQSFGNWVLFFWLFVKQMDRTQKVSEEHKADLRAFAHERQKVTGQDATD